MKNFLVIAISFLCNNLFGQNTQNGEFDSIKGFFCLNELNHFYSLSAFEAGSEVLDKAKLKDRINYYSKFNEWTDSYEQNLDTFLSKNKVELNESFENKSVFDFNIK